MRTLIALLRAVNVGGTGKLPMGELRAIAEAAGFEGIRTFIQSGNLVFCTGGTMEEAKAELEWRLAEHAGKAVSVVMREALEMQSVLQANPFPEAEPSQVAVIFLEAAPPPDTIESARGRTDEVIAVGVREVYVHYPSGMGRSKLRLQAMEIGTAGNVNTVAKLVGMAGKAS